MACLHAVGAACLPGASYRTVVYRAAQPDPDINTLCELLVHDELSDT